MGLALKGIIQGISNLSGMCYQLYNMSVAYICNFFLEIVYSVCVLCLSFYFIFLHQHKSKFLSFFIMLFKLFCLFFTFFYLSTSQDYFNSNHYPWNTKSNQKTNNSVTHIDPIKNEYFYQVNPEKIPYCQSGYWFPLATQELFLSPQVLENSREGPRKIKRSDNSNMLHIFNNNTYTDFRTANKRVLIPFYVIWLI